MGALVFLWTTGAPDQDLPATKIVFVPPAAGAPADRIGAGTREILSAPGVVQILIPEGGGVSLAASPALLWSLNAPKQGVMRAELVPLSGGDPVAERTMRGDLGPGLYALDLATSGGPLAPGQIYEFRVMIADEKTGELFVPVKGLVERREGRLAQDAADAASRGAWFDALGFLTDNEPSGRVRVRDETGFGDLLRSAGFKPEDLPQ
ncbi:hypothetical protein [Roseibium sp.]|uniref:hypothetical protein n=1 Tax=Roseibium sp. TaxID=1936156 RepID=UPI003BA9CE64